MKTRILAIATAVLVIGSVPAEVRQLQSITINYPTRSGASWPSFIAKEGGYYQKHGLDVDLVFAGHPAGIAMIVSGEAQMSSYNLESVMQASARDAVVHRRRQLAQQGVLRADVAEGHRRASRSSRARRMAVSQIGDPPYNYTSASSSKFGLGARDVQWIAVGTDVNGRAAALAAGRADATLLTPPAYFRLEEAGYKSLGNLAEHDDIFAATTYLMKKKHGRRQSQAAGAVDQGPRRGDQALLRRQGVRGEGLSGLRQADIRRRRALLRRVRERPTSSSACPTSSSGAAQGGDRSTDRPAADRTDEGVRLSQGHRQQHRRAGSSRRASSRSCSAPRIKAKRIARPKLAFKPIMTLTYRADHVGSLLRPREVLDARNDPRRHARTAPRNRGHAHSARPRAAEGSRLQDLHRRRAAPRRIHERLL